MNEFEAKVISLTRDSQTEQKAKVEIFLQDPDAYIRDMFRQLIASQAIHHLEESFFAVHPFYIGRDVYYLSFDPHTESVNYYKFDARSQSYKSISSNDALKAFDTNPLGSYKTILMLLNNKIEDERIIRQQQKRKAEEEARMDEAVRRFEEAMRRENKPQQ